METSLTNFTPPDFPETFTSLETREYSEELESFIIFPDGATEGENIPITSPRVNSKLIPCLTKIFSFYGIVWNFDLSDSIINIYRKSSETSGSDCIIYYNNQQFLTIHSDPTYLPFHGNIDRITVSLSNINLCTCEKYFTRLSSPYEIVRSLANTNVFNYRQCSDSSCYYLTDSSGDTGGYPVVTLYNDGTFASQIVSFIGATNYNPPPAPAKKYYPPYFGAVNYKKITDFISYQEMIAFITSFEETEDIYSRKSLSAVDKESFKQFLSPLFLIHREPLEYYTQTTTAADEYRIWFEFIGSVLSLYCKNDTAMSFSWFSQALNGAYNHSIELKNLVISCSSNSEPLNENRATIYDVGPILRYDKSIEKNNFTLSTVVENNTSLDITHAEPNTHDAGYNKFVVTEFLDAPLENGKLTFTLNLTGMGNDPCKQCCSCDIKEKKYKTVIKFTSEENLQEIAIIDPADVEHEWQENTLILMLAEGETVTVSELPAGVKYEINVESDDPCDENEYLFDNGESFTSGTIGEDSEGNPQEETEVEINAQRGETLEEYLERLRQKGYEALAESLKLENVEFTLQDERIKLGDLVTVDMPEFDFKAVVRVTGVKLKSQDNQTIRTISVGTPLKILRRSKI